MTGPCSILVIQPSWWQSKAVKTGAVNPPSVSLPLLVAKLYYLVRREIKREYSIANSFEQVIGARIKLTK